MTHWVPRRVKDLPPLELDSEDEYKTPRKESRKDQEYENKENDEKNTFGTLRVPKRVSELPPLESDSDEDDARNPLNCAILNDSFILSPAKSIEDSEDLAQSQATSQKNPNKDTVEENKLLANDSLFSNFGNLQITEKNGSKPEDSLFSNFGSLQITEKNGLKPSQSSQFSASSCETTESVKSVPVPARVNTTSIKAALAPIQENFESKDAPRSKSPIDCVPKKEVSEKPANDTETPFKTASSEAGQFVTPQIMSFTRRPRNLSSTQSKTRSALENEFRTKKVLFQTPMAVSRPPLACLNNDSITLSLCDTPNKDEEAPAERDEQNVKSKKSLGDLFKSSSQNENEPASAPKTSTNLIRINGKEYTIQKKIGSGGSSSVFLAHRNDVDKDCALKIVDLQGDSAIVQGYLNETKLLAKLQGNPCVVSLYEYELLAKESKLFMVMEKGDSDLHKILQSYSTDLPLFVLMNFWHQMLQSVHYIHENGVIHSDLKPANFLMVKGRLKLIDFGIASNIAIDSTSIIKFSQAGTFNYISPEALIDTSTGNSPSGKNQPKIKISTKSDVWSLGCILYLLLYKKTPFGHIKNIYAKVNAISNPTTTIDFPTLPIYYPPMLIEMAQKCLQHDPKKRSSVADLLKYPFNMIIPIPKSN